VKIVHYEGPDKKREVKKIRGRRREETRPVGGNARSGRPLEKQIRNGSNMNGEREKKARGDKKGKSFG
jgi:hypothetical protein